MYAFYRQESYERNTLSTQLLEQRLLTRHLVKGESDLVSLPERKGFKQSRAWKWLTARRDQTRQKQLTRSPEYDLVRTSGLFDAQWYRQKNPDVAAAKVDPLLHYLLHGGFEGRDPSLVFSSQQYLDAHPEARESGVNPLVHHLENGKANEQPPAGE